MLGSRVSAQAADLADAKQQNRELAAELRETDARLRVTTDRLAKSLVLTQKQLDERHRRSSRANRQIPHGCKQPATDRPAGSPFPATFPA